MTDVVEVRFKGNRKEYFTWPSAEPLALHDPVIVEVDRGQDLGRVSALGAVAAKKCGGSCSGCSLAEAAAPAEPVHRVLRRATTEDAALAEQLHHEEGDVRSGVMKGILEALALDLTLRGALDVREAFIDATFVPAKKGA